MWLNCFFHVARNDGKDWEGLIAVKDANQKIQTAVPSSAYEYEVDGLVNQTIRYGGTNQHASASFTVYVRDSSWMISTMETNEEGGINYREIGSTNGAEIYELNRGLGGFGSDDGADTIK